MTETTKVKITVNIDTYIYDELKEEAEKNSMTPSQLVRQMWQDYRKNAIRCDTPMPLATNRCKVA